VEEVGSTPIAPMWRTKKFRLCFLFMYIFLSFLAFVSGLMVVRAKNPVHSVLFSILVFRDTSGLLLLLGLDFSAMIFPVVHIVAIAVSFLFVVMIPRQWVWRGARVILKKIFGYFFVLLIAPVLWDWGLTWVAPLVVFLEEWLGFLISSMERLPLPVGGGGNAGPSNRRLLDLNRIPSPSPEPEPEPEPGPEPAPPAPLSVEEELLITKKREEVKFLIRVLLQIGYQKRARNEKEIKQLFQDIDIDSERNASFLEELHDHLQGLRRPGGHGGTSGQPQKFSNIEVQELLRWISEKRGN
jgi:hypothetical protein